MNMNNDQLRLLNDMPATSEQDRFHHEIDASILRDVLISNRSGLCVGLFGKWGSGKSTIVNILKHNLPEQYETIVFNAWKARGDTIRRQLLLAILHVICPEETYARIVKFAGIEVVQECVETAINRVKRNRIALWQTIKAAFSDWTMALPAVAGVLFLLASITCAIVAYNRPTDEDFFLTVATACFLPAFAFFLVYVINKVKERYSFLVGNMELVSESQRLQYPEQFKKVFIDNLVEYLRSSGKQRLLIVVDDIDRCDPQTVVQALAAIRQLSDSQELGQLLGDTTKGCQFLVPCDERQVVLALEADGYGDNQINAGYHDYHGELLRKFFDVVVRMSDVLPDDLGDYAAMLGIELGLADKECREIVAITGARDPRQVKKLLNALRLSHENIGRRVGALLPSFNQMIALDETERLLVALRETVPEAYEEIAANPSMISDIQLGMSLIQPDDNDKAGHNEQMEKAYDMIRMAGRASEATAIQLIYGKLDSELRTIPSGGLLNNAFTAGDDKGFSRAMEGIRADDCANVQTWLTKKVRKTKSDASTRKILRMMLCYAESGSPGAAEIVAPCVNVLLREKISMADNLSNFREYPALELVWPFLGLHAKSNALSAIHENFIKSPAGANQELAFLIRHANELDDTIAEKLKKWMMEGVAKDNESDAFEKRLYAHIRGDEERKACYGFAPEVANALSQKPEWMDDADDETRKTPEDWPRYNLVVTLAGSSPEYAEQCLSALFTNEGQLSEPQAISDSSPGYGPAWMAAGRLFSRISIERYQEYSKYILEWLRHQTKITSLELILTMLGENLYRLSGQRGSDLAGIMIDHIHAQPETQMVEIIGPAPTVKSLIGGWTLLVVEFARQGFRWLETQPSLSGRINSLIKKMGEFDWPVAVQAEHLLVNKLNDERVSDYDSWLAALAPLIRDSRIALPEAVRECLKKNVRIEEAIKAGIQILWKTEIDPEAATLLGLMFIRQQSELPEYADLWDSLRTKPGVRTTLETMLERLPSDIGHLEDYHNVLSMIAESIEKLSRQQQEEFMDQRILPLIQSNSPSAQKMGLQYASQIPFITLALKKHIKQEMKTELSDERRAALEGLLSKDMMSE